MINTDQVRIGMWGGPSAGKSKLANALGRYLKDVCPNLSVTVIREYATEWLRKHSVDTWVTTDNIQLEFTEQQVMRELGCISDIMITDCPVPLCCYWGIQHPKLSDTDKERLSYLGETWAAQYHVNVLLPTPGSLYTYQDSEIRPKKADAIRKHQGIRDMFMKHTMPDSQVIVTSAELDVTVEQIFETLVSANIL